MAAAVAEALATLDSCARMEAGSPIRKKQTQMMTPEKVKASRIGSPIGGI